MTKVFRVDKKVPLEKLKNEFTVLKKCENRFDCLNNSNMRFNEKEIKTLAAQHKCEKEGCLYFRERQEGFFRKAEGEIFLHTSFHSIFYSPIQLPYEKKHIYKNDFAEKQCVMARPRECLYNFIFYSPCSFLFEALFFRHQLSVELKTMWTNLRPHFKDSQDVD